MDIIIRYGLGSYCGVSCASVDEFLNGESEMVSYGAKLLDTAIELLSNTTNKDLEYALELLEEARSIIYKEIHK